MAPDALTPEPESPLKWVDFSRRVYSLIVGLVIVVAGASGIASTKLAQGLLRSSLETEGRAVAGAVARAAFVPLTLENEEAIKTLTESYRDMKGLSLIRVRDARGKVVHEADFERAARVLSVRASVVPLTEPGEARGAAIGEVEVGLSEERLDRLSRQIAWLNMAVSAGLALLISLIGWFLVRTLVARMRELVGEARLVAQVRQANAELESFSYSVSHDLRAPLRAVAGFATILHRRLAKSLDEESRGDLERITAGAKRMGEIIEDLLSLSRVSRRELDKTRVDLSALASAIVAELRERQPGRSVTTVVQKGLTAHADATLLRTALENLLDNAWKYTSKTADARVEFGAEQKQGERCFYVRDNGAGFDMAYAANLFKPFQRLHRDAEFEGTGIGLATVERVMRRHGGRIWAVAEPGKGATFYFTLTGERRA